VLLNSERVSGDPVSMGLIGLEEATGEFTPSRHQPYYVLSGVSRHTPKLPCTSWTRRTPRGSMGCARVAPLDWRAPAVLPKVRLPSMRWRHWWCTSIARYASTRLRARQTRCTPPQHRRRDR
jgi:hypothetical protein